MEPQTPSPTVQPVATPFHASWLFWLLIVLISVLSFIVYSWFAPLIVKPLVLEVKNDGNAPYIHVIKLVGPADGFLVVRGEKGDELDVELESSPYILKGTYTDFKIPFIVRDPADSDFYSKLVSSSRFFVTYYLDDNHDGVYNDNKVSKDFFGRRLEVIIDSGKPL